MLSKESIKEYQKIYEQEYGEKISLDEAEKQGEQLLRLYKAVYKGEREWRKDSST